MKKQLYNDVKQAYLFLKNSCYHNQLDVFVKEKIAIFEYAYRKYNEDIFFKKLTESVYKLIEHPEKIKVQFKIIPKKTEDLKESGKFLFLTNNKTHNSYNVESLNYFIDIDIPTRILDILWILKEGIFLDKNFEEHIYANRLNIDTNNHKIHSQSLFKHYAQQYGLWRDTAISQMKKLTKENKNVLVISMDIAKYFYNIDMQKNIYKKLEKDIQKHSNSKTLYTNILDVIHRKYRKSIKKYMSLTHNESKDKKFIPIGLLSSSIIANWYLQNLDRSIIDNLNPYFYGRYVDDILIVKHISQNKFNTNLIDTYLEKVFKKTNVNNKYKYEYKPSNLFIQENKLIIHYFDKKHLTAGLNIFKKEIQKNASIFRFLPEQEISQRLDEVAYDLVYKGSTNTFRSLVDYKENATKLSTYLTSQLILNKLTNKNEDSNEISKSLTKFFKGQNFIDFIKVLGKAFAFFIIENKIDDLFSFYEECINVFKNIKHKEAKIEKEIEKNIKHYVNILLAHSFALIDINEINKNKNYKEIRTLAKKIKFANMFDHSLISIPLLNYTNFEGNYLTNPDALNGLNLQLNQQKINLSPRYIHLDEFILFETDLNSILQPTLDKDFVSIKKRIKYNKFLLDKIGIQKHDNITKIKIPERDNTKNLFDEHITIGIVNMKVDERDIKKSFEDLGKNANISFKKQSRLYSILNLAEKHKVNLLVFPEFAIPPKWFPFMAAYSRRHQMGLVFGLEYVILRNNNLIYACNYLATCIPFTYNNYKICLPLLRLKNHYAPREYKLLQECDYIIPELKKHYYHLINWEGLNFAPFICFELADINHRAMFKLNLDLLVAAVWNKDLKYFEDVLNSTSRDLHCYVAEVNTSEYGESCLIQPTKKEMSKILGIKGGINDSILVANLDIKKLRDFQKLRRFNSCTDFKPIPPGEKGKF